MKIALADYPDTEFSSRLLAEIDEPRDIAESGLRVKLDDVFLGQHAHELFVGIHHFCKERGRLLPFTFFGDVAVVSLTECEDGEQIPFFVEIVPQPTPGGEIGCGKLREWRGPEFGMLSGEGGDLQRIHITDRSQAARSEEHTSELQSQSNL